MRKGLKTLNLNSINTFKRFLSENFAKVPVNVCKLEEADVSLWNRVTKHLTLQANSLKRNHQDEIKNIQQRHNEAAVAAENRIQYLQEKVTKLRTVLQSASNAFKVRSYVNRCNFIKNQKFH